MKVLVIGAGYVGLVTGVCLAANGHEVSIVDTDEQKVEKLKNGISPIYEPGLESLMELHKTRLSYTTQLKESCKDKRIIMICVGTPQKEDGAADLSYVMTAMQKIIKYADNRSVIVTKSTVPVGTNDKLQSIADASGKKLYLVSNPEFLQQGKAVINTMYPSRIVIGVEEPYAKNIMKNLYQNLDGKKLFMKRSSAEMAKYASNNFLALKISYINEIANLCDVMDADVMDVANAMGYDSRIGSEFLHPGIGFGGSCFPKDTKALIHQAEECGLSLRTIKSLVDVNEQQKFRLIEKAEQELGNLKGKTISILGLTFKAGTDDLRESPAIPIIQHLLKRGCIVKAWDPFGKNACQEYFHDSVRYCESIKECILDADCCFITAEWKEIIQTSPEVFIKNMKSPIIFDGRNCLDKESYKHAGIKYEGIGTK